MPYSRSLLHVWQVYGIIPEGYRFLYGLDFWQYHYCDKFIAHFTVFHVYCLNDAHSINNYCSKLERKATDMRSALSTYSTWQSLPARDALHQSQALHSTLRSIATRCEDMEMIPRATAKISFEAPCSDVLTTLGHLGRFKIAPKGDDEQHTKKNNLSNKNKEQLSQNSVHETHSNEGQPPNKKRKELI